MEEVKLYYKDGYLVVRDSIDQSRSVYVGAPYKSTTTVASLIADLFDKIEHTSDRLDETQRTIESMREGLKSL